MAAERRGPDDPARRRRRPEPELGPQVGREDERPPLAEPDAGAGIVRADEVGTAAFVVAAVAGVLAPDALALPVVVVSLALFFAGTVAFLWAYAIAVGRSRADAIGMGGLFFLSGSAPRTVQRRMMALLAVQVVVGLAAASIRIFTGVAFAVLVPMYGIGLAGLWGARHGAFPPRVLPGDRSAGDGDARAGRGGAGHDGTGGADDAGGAGDGG